MDRFDAIRLFVSAVDGGSLAIAGRRHGRSPAAVTRAVAELEREAGETLLLRSTRRLSLTSAGERRLLVWRDVISRLDELLPQGGGSEPVGRVVITAPELFGRHVVLPLIDTFLERYPRVTARLLLLNRTVNLIGEGVDLAVRLAPLQDSTLTAVRVGEVRTQLCASPAYCDRAGVPATPDDLQHHDCIGLDATADDELWSFIEPSGGRRRSIRIRPRLSINGAAAAIDEAIRGRGVIQARSYQVATAITDGQLMPLLSEWQGPPIPVHLVFPPARGARRPLRTLIDELAPQLRRALSGELTAS